MISPIPWETPSSPIIRRHHANVRATVAGLLVDIHKKLVDLGRGRRTDSPVYHRFRRSGRLLTICMCLSFRRSSPKPRQSTRNTRRADVIIELGGEDAKIHLPETHARTAHERFVRRWYRARSLTRCPRCSTPTPPASTRWPRATRTCIQSPRVVVCSPKPICSRSSMMVPPSPIWPPPSSPQWPRRPSPAWLPDAPIHGTVIFLGGPLFFMSELRAAFPARA